MSISSNIPPLERQMATMTMQSGEKDYIKFNFHDKMLEIKFIQKRKYKKDKIEKKFFT